MLLLALLLLLFLSSPSAFVRGDEDAVEDFDETEEEAEEAAPEDDPVVEADPEPEPEPEAVEEKKAEPVVNVVPGIPVPDEGKNAPSLGSKAKNALGPLVDKVVSRSRSAIDRVKNMSKSDAKKVAAAALGIWGVSVGVGWLAQTANKN
jgi:hypothetical protein